MALFFAGLRHYAGSTPVYLVFSAVFAALLASAFYRRESYAYLFLAAFVWLGFWFKLTANFLLFGSFPFGEPVGNFDSSAQAWDKALWIAAAAGAGLLLGRLAYGLLTHASAPIKPTPRAPGWYQPMRAWLWLLAVIASVGIAAINVVYGIHQIGISPRTVLHWPLNALIAWMLNLGLAVIFATLVWWDAAGDPKITWPFAAMLGDAFLSTVSVISRASFPFHSLPQMLALNDQAKIRARHGARERLAATALFLFFCVASIGAVSFLRDQQYTATTAAPTPEPKTFRAPSVEGAGAIEKPITAPSAPKAPVSSFRLILIHQLLVNRWIGLEGVMAVSAYPDTGFALLRDMLVEKREPGKATQYQKVSNSGYQNADPKYQFASLPGAAAFLYFSGSMMVVAMGMAVAALALMAFEKLTLRITGNPLLASLFGLTLANIVAQFGMTPRQDIPTIALICGSILAVGALQSPALTEWIRRRSERLHGMRP